MGDVYSLYSGKRLAMQDIITNDKLANAKGRYIGVLPKSNARNLRDHQEMLIVEQAQINELIKSFDNNYKSYLLTVASTLMYLGIDPKEFDPQKEKLFIGEDGHMWAVPKEIEQED